MESYRKRFQAPNAAELYHESLQKRIDWRLWEELIVPELYQVLTKLKNLGAEKYLDFACGTGRVIDVSGSIFPHTTAIDISPQMIKFASSRHENVSFIVADVTAEPSLILERFDCVTIFRFLLNAESSLRRQALSWLSKHVEPGGYLVGNVHLHSLIVAGMLAMTSHRFFGRSVSYLSRKETETLLEKAGFKVEEWRGYRILPTLMGRSLLGDSVQLKGEKLCKKLGLGVIGSDQMFVARRCK